MNVYTIESLSEAEVAELEDRYHHHPKRRVRQRAHMVLLSHQGFSLGEIAQIVRVTRQTVSKTIHGYEEEGAKALEDPELPGRPPILNESQQQQVAQWLDQTPRDLGYQQSNWTVKLLRYHIQQTFGQAPCWEQVRVLVKKLGFSLVRPTHASREADETEKRWAKAILGELEALARQGWIRLFYEDETELSRFPTLTRVWTRTGHQKTIPTDDDHRSFWVYGVFDPISGQTHYRLHPKLESAGFWPFVTQLKRRYAEEMTERPLVIVLDNASAHGYKGRHGLVKVADGLYFYFLPPYCPRLNRAERPWKELRKRVTHNFLFECLEALKEAARRTMMYLQVMKWRVVSIMGVVEPVRC
ncbi:MAG: IS630 family transposase [Candidatus Bipolaricaulia bacterium]